MSEAVTNNPVLWNYLQLDTPGTYYQSLGSGLGWGLGAALGAKLAAPSKTIICTIGDGSWVFSSPIAVYWAAEQHHSPFLTVIFNNQEYAATTEAILTTAPKGYARKTGTIPCAICRSRRCIPGWRRRWACGPGPSTSRPDCSRCFGKHSQKCAGAVPRWWISASRHPGLRPMARRKQAKFGESRTPFVACHQGNGHTAAGIFRAREHKCPTTESRPAGCLHHFVFEQAERNPNAVAILAPGRSPLTYSRLRRQVEQVVQELNSRGFGRQDRIAMVLPEGPEMAVAFVAIAAGATCAPLNPAYRTRELNYYLKDLNATALLVPSGSESPAAAVARSQGIPVLELIPQTAAEAGLFTLGG